MPHRFACVAQSTLENRLLLTAANADELCEWIQGAEDSLIDERIIATREAAALSQEFQTLFALWQQFQEELDPAKAQRLLQKDWDEGYFLRLLNEFVKNNPDCDFRIKNLLTYWNAEHKAALESSWTQLSWESLTRMASEGGLHQLSDLLLQTFHILALNKWLSSEAMAWAPQLEIASSFIAIITYLLTLHEAGENIHEAAVLKAPVEKLLNDQQAVHSTFDLLTHYAIPQEDINKIRQYTQWIEDHTEKEINQLAINKFRADQIEEQANERWNSAVWHLVNQGLYLSSFILGYIAKKPWAQLDEALKSNPQQQRCASEALDLAISTDAEDSLSAPIRKTKSYPLKKSVAITDLNASFTDLRKEFAPFIRPKPSLSEVSRRLSSGELFLSIFDFHARNLLQQLERAQSTIGFLGSINSCAISGFQLPSKITQIATSSGFEEQSLLWAQVNEWEHPQMATIAESVAHHQPTVSYYLDWMASTARMAAQSIIFVKITEWALGHRLLHKSTATSFLNYGLFGASLIGAVKTIGDAVQASYETNQAAQAHKNFKYDLVWGEPRLEPIKENFLRIVEADPRFAVQSLLAKLHRPQSAQTVIDFLSAVNMSQPAITALENAEIGNPHALNYVLHFFGIK